LGKLGIASRTEAAAKAHALRLFDGPAPGNTALGDTALGNTALSNTALGDTAAS